MPDQVQAWLRSLLLRGSHSVISRLVEDWAVRHARYSVLRITHMQRQVLLVVRP